MVFSTSQSPVSRLANASDAAHLADLINTYNTIVRTTPPRRPGAWGFVRYFFINRHPVGQKRQSLWQLEQSIRAFGDPRIHFALNCGSHSCPPIRSYAGETLDAQLHIATGSYLANEDALRIDDVSRTVYLSRLFYWYRRDFPQPLVFILPYLSPSQQSMLSCPGPAPRIRYLKWNWVPTP